jgi:hypothetical protein
MTVKRKKFMPLSENKLWLISLQSVIILSNLFQLIVLRKIPSNEKRKDWKDAGIEHILVLYVYKFVTPA